MRTAYLQAVVGDFFLIELFLISVVKEERNPIIKIKVIASFIDDSPESNVNSKTMLTNTINEMVIYSGLILGTFCKSISLRKIIKH
ncbi:hypothetical protein ACQCVP_23950 [Rossellomorea vietnamensis]|uniref:hypothetical protein n=1 Tax=Rossellomorea vietnamensis TaxID=218284 RepID=UPI003CF515E2